MGAVIATDRLRYELARWGWGNADLARAAKVSPPTVTAALAGRPVAPRTLKRIAMALSATPPLAGAEDILLK
jgi:hypothetical protein